MHKFLLFSDIHVVRPHHPRRRQFRPVSPAASAAFAGPATLVAPAVRPALAGSPVRTLLLWRALCQTKLIPPKVWNYAAESRRQKLNGKCNDKYRPHPRFRPQPNIQDHEQHIDRTSRQVDDEQDVIILIDCLDITCSDNYSRPSTLFLSASVFNPFNCKNHCIKRIPDW